MIHNLREFRDVRWLAGGIDNEDARKVGIHVGAAELDFYRSSPWIEAYADISTDGAVPMLHGFASGNLSERRYGRGIFNEFYVPPAARGNRIRSIRFYRWCVGNMFKGCHRVVAYVRADNELVVGILKAFGWKQECAVKDFGGRGYNFIQLSTRGQGA